jgi:hypothetical protein
MVSVLDSGLRRSSCFLHSISQLFSVVFVWNSQHIRICVVIYRVKSKRWADLRKTLLWPIVSLTKSLAYDFVWPRTAEKGNEEVLTHLTVEMWLDLFLIAQFATAIVVRPVRLLEDTDLEDPHTIELLSRPIGRLNDNNPDGHHLPLHNVFEGTDLQVGHHEDHTRVNR